MSVQQNRPVSIVYRFSSSFARFKKKKRKRRSYLLLEITPAPIKPSTQMSNAVPIGDMVGTGTGVGGGVGVQTTVAVSSSETHVLVSPHHAVAFTRFTPSTHPTKQRASNSIVMLSPGSSDENHHQTRLGDVYIGKCVGLYAYSRPAGNMSSTVCW